MKKIAWAMAAMAVSSVFAGEFKAGFARVDITPPLGVFMPGYYKIRYAKQVLDPLQINMVAFSDGQATALVAQIDTVALSDSVADGMRDAIVAATGVDREAILLHATHTHDGGFLTVNASNGSMAHCKTGPLDDLYVALATRRAADAAVMAIADLKPAKLSIGTSAAHRISFGRSYLMKNGKVVTNPGTGNPDIVRPVGTADETVQVLRIDREGGKPICVINFQTHPDTVGGETLSADWPGLTRRVFEAATQNAAHCLVLNGAQGDVNHCNVMPRPGEMNGLKRDFDAVDRGYDHAKHMANVLAGAALSVWMKCEPVQSGRVRFSRVRIPVPANKAKDTDAKNLAWAKEVWALHEQGRDAEISKRYGCYEMELTTEVARAGRIIRMATHDDYHRVPLWAISIGEVAFAAFPGEPFNEIGIAIRKQSPFKMTLLTCLTNGSMGYFPFRASYTRGGYESATSPFGPSVADDLIDGATRLLDALANERPYVTAPDARHTKASRKFTGIPSLEQSPKNGRLWCTWYAGPTANEDENNYVVLATSTDNGATWREVLTADPDGFGGLRAFDPEVWISPDGTLRWTWTERFGSAGDRAENDRVMCVELNAEDEPTAPFPQPVATVPGIMMCKPTVLSSGEWLYPAARWGAAPSSEFYATRDGRTFELRGGATLPEKDRLFDEQMVLERKDGELVAFIRTRFTTRLSTSRDGGRTWSEPKESATFRNFSTRLFVRRLKSGAVLLVKNGRTPTEPARNRAFLTAYVSYDDGHTWEGGLLLDDNEPAAYPDGVEGSDGVIRIVYDHSRSKDMDIYLATFTEADVKAGKAVSGRCHLRQVVTKR